MKQRIITGAIILALVLVMLFLSGTWAYPAVITLLSVIGTWEMLGCVGERKTPILSIPALAAAAAAPTAAYFLGHGAVAAIVVLLMFLVLFSSVFTGESVKTQSVCAVFTTTVYVVVCFSSLLLLRYVEYDGRTVGQYLIVLVFVAAWITDTFAYFVGYFFGKHKLIPKVSPKKTVEGAVGGIVFCAVAFLIYGATVRKLTDYIPNYIVLTVLGIALSAVSQLGDLLASAIKRSYRVKDNGKLFPGHGGVLDRFDSVMALAPALLILVKIVTCR